MNTPSTMPCENPIFIVGSPRSGTTLLRNLLDTHPRIFCPDWETGFFVAFDQVLRGDIHKVIKEYPGFPLTPDDLADWTRRCFSDLFERFALDCGKDRWAEKTPAHVFHIELIREIFPKSQIIHVIRNGRDVVRSLQNQSWAPREIRWSVDRWVRSVQAGQRAGKEMDATSYCEVRYESMLADPEAEAKRLCEFLDEPFDAGMLAFDDPKRRSWKTESKPLATRALNKYRDLSFRERFLFRRLAGPLMAELGYVET